MDSSSSASASGPSPTTIIIIASVAGASILLFGSLLIFCLCCRVRPDTGTHSAPNSRTNLMITPRSTLSLVSKSSSQEGTPSQRPKSLALHHPSPAVGFTSPAVSHSSPAISFSTPAVNHSSPAVSFSTPAPPSLSHSKSQHSLRIDTSIIRKPPPRDQYDHHPAFWQ
ncbi:uncharacterized protein BJ171DRAFT_597321 [Polychytrium aggregatum]|uniref:uncharacterized protein n=1 Tax=Polychytrium aggregatum TaxID=110093 RepID=UPI0022FE5EE8|nr:uncharacterized protein BJ171DRAFT_597321 [Polychytrium aggregatum]KAI9206659.1 hypothetical protein BJ171DRAFT_597321 [Polychytrium aggregatum]